LENTGNKLSVIVNLPADLTDYMELPKSKDKFMKIYQKTWLDEQNFSLGAEERI
jgi:hypothetical protein